MNREYSLLFCCCCCSFLLLCASYKRLVYFVLVCFFSLSLSPYFIYFNGFTFLIIEYKRIFVKNQKWEEEKNLWFILYLKKNRIDEQKWKIRGMEKYTDQLRIVRDGEREICWIFSTIFKQSCSVSFSILNNLYISFWILIEKA